MFDDVIVADAILAPVIVAFAMLEAVIPPEVAIDPVMFPELSKVRNEVLPTGLGRVSEELAAREAGGATVIP
jgi:hypothetical protein